MYSEGIFYSENENEFEVITPPKNAVIDELPEEIEEVILGDMTVYELYETLYAETEEGYKVLGTLDELKGTMGEP